MRLVVRRQDAPSCPPPWHPNLGDKVEFVGERAKGMEFPQGTVHYYTPPKGMRGVVVGYVGKDVVVRTERSTAPPGYAYGDFWAPMGVWRLVEKGTNAEPPHVPAPGPFGRRDAEEILQAWARSKGLPPIPPFDVEKFVAENPYIEEPKTREEWRKVNREE
jgi:hypothetical protein